MNYIWGVWCTADNELHRDNMTEDEAREWVDEWNSMVENSKTKPNIFLVCRRPVGEWQIMHPEGYYTVAR